MQIWVKNDIAGSCRILDIRKLLCDLQCEAIYLVTYNLKAVALQVARNILSFNSGL